MKIPVTVLAALAAFLASPAMAKDLPVLVRADRATDVFLAARLQGRLHLDEAGCLRIAGHDGEPGHFVIWPHGSSIERAGDGRIRITDGFNGRVAHLGDEVVMGGGETTATPIDGLTEPVPEACASGTFWVSAVLADARTPRPEDLPTFAEDEVPVLVTARERQEAFVSNLGRARLVVDENGCLRLGDAFVIWPHGSRISRTGDGLLRVVNGANGKAVLVGQEIGMSGGSGDFVPDPYRLAQPVPGQCGGPYMWGGPVVTEAELRAMDERRRNRVPVPLPPEAADTLRHDD